MSEFTQCCVQCKEPRKPAVYKIKSCGHRICERCLQEIRHSQKAAICPGRTAACQTADLLETESGVELDRESNQKNTYCGYKEYGCTETMQLVDRKHHMSLCLFIPLLCPNQKSGCKVRLAKKKMKEHEDVCEYRRVLCAICQCLVLLKDKDNHQDRCLLGAVKNPAKTKEKKLAEEDLIEQLEIVTIAAADNAKSLKELESATDCLNQVTQFSVKQQSTDDRIKQLEGNSTPFQRVKPLQQGISSQHSKLNEMDLRFQCLLCTEYKGKLSWKISEYQDRKQNQPRFDSPFVYTEPRGYKMKGRVDLDDSGEFKVFLVLVPGDFDEILQWPLKRQVALKLCDQKTRGGGKQEVFTVTFTKPRRDDVEIVWTNNCLSVVHDVVESDRYLVDDVIFLQINVNLYDLESTDQDQDDSGSSVINDFPDTQYSEEQMGIVSSNLDTRGQRL